MNIPIKPPTKIKFIPKDPKLGLSIDLRKIPQIIQLVRKLVIKIKL